MGIPLVFILISTIEMARGMWIYHTLAYSVKEGTRYAIGRGQNSPTKATVQRCLQRHRSVRRWLAARRPQIDLYVAQRNQPHVLCRQFPNTAWPPGDNAGVIDNQPGQSISIAGYYPFVSTIAMFWPGAGAGMQFNNLTCQGLGTLCLPATSKDVMQF